MTDRNKKILYSKITRREILFSSVFFVLIALGVIIFSIRDIVNGQLFKPIIHLLLAAFLLFFVGFLHRKRNQSETLNQTNLSQYELSAQERFSAKTSIHEESSSEESRVSFIAKAVIGFYLLLIVGVGLLVFAVLCKLHSCSTTEFLILALIIGSIAVLIFIPRLASPVKYDENGQVLLRRLTVNEQIIAVVAIISLCTGVVLWFFH
jgi:hypothetical protein